MSIHPETTIGAVHMTISNLDRSIAFYQDRIGLKTHRRDGATAFLGAGGPDLLVLYESASAPRASGTTGLYHFAILVPSRRHLALSLRRLMETGTPTQGFADHLVSESIYLPDPDRNGIEIYRDRPRSEWPYDHGRIRMATDPLDLDDVLSELRGDETWEGLAPQTTIGHVHLHVSHLQDAETFYVGVLEFDLMLRFGPSALFMSAGGYHHHLGANTWVGVGAPPPPPGAIGLRHFEVRLPDQREVERVVGRIKNAGIAISEVDAGVIVREPSQ